MALTSNKWVKKTIDFYQKKCEDPVFKNFVKANSPIFMSWKKTADSGYFENKRNRMGSPFDEAWFIVEASSVYAGIFDGRDNVSAGKHLAFKEKIVKGLSSARKELAKNIRLSTLDSIPVEITFPDSVKSIFSDVNVHFEGGFRDALVNLLNLCEKMIDQDPFEKNYYRWSSWAKGLRDMKGKNQNPNKLGLHLLKLTQETYGTHRIAYVKKLIENLPGDKGTKYSIDEESLKKLRKKYLSPRTPTGE